MNIALTVKKISDQWVVTVVEDGEPRPDAYYYSSGSSKDDKSDCVDTANAMAVRYRKDGHSVGVKVR